MSGVTKVTDRRIDQWGRVVMNPDAVFRLALEGHDVWSIPVDPSPEIERFNATLAMFDKPGLELSPPEPLETTPDEEHALHAAAWLVSEDIRTIPVREFLIGLCQSDEENTRVDLEMDLYEERDLIPLLQLMMYLVNHFRENDIVWGVGRGSSVSSFVLYLIGVHKVNSLKYGLEIKEFLK